MNIYDEEHPHHVLWKQYMMSVFDKKPLSIQYNVYSSGEDDWEDADNCPNGIVRIAWSSLYRYRIKPEEVLVELNGYKFSYPKPFDGPIGPNQQYWVVCSVGKVSLKVNQNQFLWFSDQEEHSVHLVEENAKRHSQVIEYVLELI